MRAVVTGAAGFIGSHLSERLIADGHEVVGIDAFTDYYDVSLKRLNITRLVEANRFELIEGDICELDLVEILRGTDVVFHQAGQPGVRLSWSDGFDIYVERNVIATQKLLEAAREIAGLKLVYASSSSLYGNQATYPTTEATMPAPFSPYGVTKLAGEHLCNLYAENWGVSTVALRYFTVYGPRQRPDMAMTRLIGACFDGPVFPMFGDGSQLRDFTYVGDIVEANVLAATADVAPGTVCNIAGGGSTSLVEVIDLVGKLVGGEVPIDRQPFKAGDVMRTGATTDRAKELLGWTAKVSVAEGLANQVEWYRNLSKS